MSTNKKLLPLEEQTLLLTSLLFARKHLDEILSFLPDHQSVRMHEAKFRFLKLEQEERITEIITELRRLLLLKEHTIRWIHKSWIDEELDKEPVYLRTILNACLSGSKTPHELESKLLPNDMIVQSFLAPFLKTPQKIAIFDPVLMRLQSLNRTNQEQTIQIIGQYALSALSTAFYRKRFIKFVIRCYEPDIPLSFDHLNSEGNAFGGPPYKKALFSLVLTHKGERASALALNAGLLVMALYLFSEKPRWHRMIELVLARKHGLMLRAMISAHKNIAFDAKSKAAIGSLLIDAMEGAFI